MKTITHHRPARFADEPALCGAAPHEGWHSEIPGVVDCPACLEALAKQAEAYPPCEPVPPGIHGTPINIHGTPCRFEVSHYVNTGRLAIVVMGGGDFPEPFGNLTVNIPEAELEPGEICVRDWAENEMLAAVALETGLFEDTGKRVPTGYVTAPIWRVK